MQYIIAPHPALEGEQAQNQQRSRPNPRIGQRGECQHCQRRVRHHRLRQATHNSCHKNNQTKWCTGKDSNLRTSLGGTDLQSVGFNHSPTCAKAFGRCGPVSTSEFDSRRGGRKALANPQTERTKARRYLRKYNFRNSGKPRIALTKLPREDHCTPDQFRMKCVGKTCCAAEDFRCLPEPPEFTACVSYAGAGEGI
jgi:hypothetical protein